MVTTKNSFRHMLARKYPQSKVLVTPGYPIFIIDVPLDETDSRLYFSKPLEDGTYWTTYIQDKDEVKKLYAAYSEGGIEARSFTWTRNSIPTSYSAFENYLLRHNIKPLEKKYVRGKPRNILLFEGTPLNNDPEVWETSHDTWMLYEFDYKDGKAECNTTNCSSDCTQCNVGNAFSLNMLRNVPYYYDLKTQHIYILAKASKSKYISKKSKLMRQPVKDFDVEDF